MSTDNKSIYEAFNKNFPLETLGQLPLDKYTNLNRSDSFCYWLESKTYHLGSIWGGSSYKFGIYAYNAKPKAGDPRIVFDDHYAWYSRYKAETAEDAWKIVRNDLVRIAKWSREGKFEEIDKDKSFGEVVKWKIAFLYSNLHLLPVYSNDKLEYIALDNGMENAHGASIAAMQKYLLTKINGDVLTFYENNVEPKLHTLEEEETPKTWIYSPGESASEWETCLKDGIMCLGWSDVGDFKDFKSLSETRAKMKKIYDKEDRPFTNDGLAVWEFSHVMKKGDVVFAKKGMRKIIGRGIVQSDYQYDGTYDVFPNIRKVDWQVTGEWDVPNNMAMKTLTEITMRLDLIKQYNDVISGEGTIAPPDSSVQHDNELYSKTDFLNEVYMSSEDYDKLRNLLEYKKNMILQGAPGVGKTFCAKRLAYSIMGEKDDKRVAMVQFHQNYSYEDFMMGYRPDGNGFVLKKGIFYEFCKKAQKEPDKPYFFIIDEINRGNLSKIFGELLMLIEKEYRGEEIRLAYNDEPFSVPANLYIIGMMNTADRSLAMIDYALRRRFSFFNMQPAFDSEGFKTYQQTINDETFNKVIDGIKYLNDDIKKDNSLGEGFCIGHSYFCGGDITKERLVSIIDYDIKPMIREYWFDNDSKYQEEFDKLDNLLK